MREATTQFSIILSREWWQLHRAPIDVDAVDGQNDQKKKKKKKKKKKMMMMMMMMMMMGG